MKKLVNIFYKRHANLDSFPLRYGFSFSKNTTMELIYDQATLKPDKTYKDRYNLIAQFTNPQKNNTERGRFYLINEHKNQAVKYDEVATVIRTSGDTKTEHHLSAVIRSLRESGDITVNELIQMNPLYVNGKIKKHGDLLKILVEKKSADEISRIQDMADEAVKKYEEENRQLKQKNKRLQSEVDAFNEQERIANMQGDTQNLEKEKRLISVNTEVLHRGSSCTELVMEDGTRLYMKTITFDRDLSVTAKAQSLIGMKVRTSCWDPIREPGKWSSQGYFRNIYALPDQEDWKDSTF